MRRTAVALALAALGTLGCQDTIGPALVTSIVLNPTADTLGLGESVVLLATLTRARGDTATGLPIVWSASDTSVVTVDTTGYATAVGIGTADVRAVIGARSASATITVTDSGPTIAMVTPSTGTAGTRLAIYGAHFRPGATVLLDTLTADSIVRRADTLITAVVPAAATQAGVSYVITVRNTDGSRVAQPSLFSISRPVLQFANGASRPAGRVGQAVVLEGQAFGDQQAGGQVLFSDTAGGTVPATIARAADWTNTAILTVVPSGAATGVVSVQTVSGTSDSLTFAVTPGSTFTPASLTWTATTALPLGLSGAAAVAGQVTDTSAFVYVIGGADGSGAPRSDVIFSAIQSGGGLGAWTETAPLPTATAFAAAVIATPSNSRIRRRPGSIYVLGGVSTGGAPVATVFQGALQADGTVMGWSGTGLPLPLHSMGAAMIGGDLYVVGGSTSGDAPVATVYRARVDSLGVLGAWQQEPSLPFARSYAGVGAWDGYLYAFGGDSAAVTPDDAGASAGTKLGQIAYAKLDLLTGDLAGWTVNGAALTVPVSKHTAVLAGGSVLLTGGLYQGATADSTEERYAVLNADGSVGSFTTLTGAHTIVSAGGRALFNHAAVTYVDAGGVAHVVILGGDDVAAPGTKRAQVWVY